MSAKKPHGNTKYDWDKIDDIMRAYAKLGIIGVRALSKLLGIPQGTIENHLRSNPALKDELKMISSETDKLLIFQAIKQAEKGYWPAIEWLLNRKIIRVLDLLEEEEKIENGQKIIIEFVDIETTKKKQKKVKVRGKKDE